MYCRFSLLLVILYYMVVFDSGVTCDEPVTFFIKAAKSKNIPRVGKRNKNASNEDFEKFFLKASKSVPRIGRRGSAPAAFFPLNANEWINVPYPYMQEDPENKIKYPLWSEIAERFEYDPELLASPEMLSRLQQEMGQNFPAYETDKLKTKRTESPMLYKIPQNVVYPDGLQM